MRGVRRSRLRKSRGDWLKVLKHGEAIRRVLVRLAKEGKRKRHTSMTVNIAVRPETGKWLKDIRIQLVIQLETSKVMWERTINTLIEFWSQSRAGASTSRNSSKEYGT